MLDAHAQRGEPFAAEHRVASRIVVGREVVDVAVDLDDEACGGEVEIDDPAEDDVLRTGAHTHTLRAERLPERPLGRRHLAAERAGSLDLAAFGQDGVLHGSTCHRCGRQPSVVTVRANSPHVSSLPRALPLERGKGDR